jgi:hypothetical protein
MYVSNERHFICNFVQSSSLPKQATSLVGNHCMTERVTMMQTQNYADNVTIQSFLLTEKTN